MRKSISKAQALQRTNVVVPAPGILRDDEPLPLTTYDLRKWRYAGSIGDRASDYPINFGKGRAASGLVTVGGHVTQNIPTDTAWDEYYHSALDGNGCATYVYVADWMVSFNLDARDVWDGFRPRAPVGHENDSDATWLLAGAYFSRVHDDTVENDDLLSGTVRDVLVDETFVGFSERGSSHTGSTLKLRGVVMRLGIYTYGGKPGIGKIFKWSDAGGRVDAANCTFLLDGNTNQSESSQEFPAGIYSNVTVILGPGFDGEYPAELPEGVKVSRDVSIFDTARSGWLARHSRVKPDPRTSV